MPDPKKQLHIALAEPVVFLRTLDPSGRVRSDPNDPPTLVRGILTLDVVKPIAISSIEVELSATLMVNYPEDVPEKEKIYSSTVTVFHTNKASRVRHSVSVGPGLSHANFNEDEGAAPTSFRPPSLPRGRPERRSMASTPLDLGPSPPYTAAQSSIQSRLDVPAENPPQTMEELRQALRDNLEGHHHEDVSSPSSSRSHITFSPNLMMHSNPSTISNDSFHREGDDILHTSPSLEGGTSLHSSAEEHSYVPPFRGASPSLAIRAHSPESTQGTRPRSRGSSHDHATAGNSRLRLSLTSVLDAVREITSRTPSRSRSAARWEERERGRPRIRIVPEERTSDSILEAGEGVATLGGGGNLAPNVSPPGGHSEHREHHLLGLGRILGLERDHDKDRENDHKSKEHEESWREFKLGTYSFPISFLLPSRLPPTFSLPNASLSYAIKGVAHRPGAFTSKLSCYVPLLVVAAPAIEAGEGAGDPGPLFVQQQWQGKLAYSLGLSSRLLLLGSRRRLEAAASESVCANTESLSAEVRAEAVYGATTLDLTLLPTEKIKIWRLEIFADQCVRYLGERGRPLRDDDKMQVKLLEMQDKSPAEDLRLTDEEKQTHLNKYTHNNELLPIPLLPTPISPHRSPLLRYLHPSTDLSALAGPGPYMLSANFGLPGCSDSSDGDSGSGLHFTVKQKNSRVKVEHFLRLVMRVECVGGQDTSQGEKKKLFDIAVRTPITILSCRSVPEYQALPRYSRFSEDNLQDYNACSCSGNIVRPTEQSYRPDSRELAHHPHGRVTLNSASSSFESERANADAHRNPHESFRSPSRIMPAGATCAREGAAWSMSPGAGPSHIPSHSSHGRHHPARPQSCSVSTSHVRSGSQTPPLSSSTSHHSRPASPLARYERLVSGLESEAGEAPPSYESVAPCS